MAISNQARYDVDEAVNWATVASVLNLGDVFELIHHTFDNSTLSEEQFIHPGHQSIFHIFLELGDELHAERLQKLLE